MSNEYQAALEAKLAAAEAKLAEVEAELAKWHAAYKGPVDRSGDDY